MDIPKPADRAVSARAADKKIIINFDEEEAIDADPVPEVEDDERLRGTPGKYYYSDSPSYPSESANDSGSDSAPVEPVPTPSPGNNQQSANDLPWVAPIRVPPVLACYSDRAPSQRQRAQSGNQPTQTRGMLSYGVAAGESGGIAFYGGLYVSTQWGSSAGSARGIEVSGSVFVAPVGMGTVIPFFSLPVSETITYTVGEPAGSSSTTLDAGCVPSATLVTPLLSLQANARESGLGNMQLGSVQLSVGLTVGFGMFFGYNCSISWFGTEGGGVEKHAPEVP